MSEPLSEYESDCNGSVQGHRRPFSQGQAIQGESCASDGDVDSGFSSDSVEEVVVFSQHHLPSADNEVVDVDAIPSYVEATADAISSNRRYEESIPVRLVSIHGVLCSGIVKTVKRITWAAL